MLWFAKFNVKSGTFASSFFLLREQTLCRWYWIHESSLSCASLKASHCHLPQKTRKINWEIKMLSQWVTLTQQTDCYATAFKCPVCGTVHCRGRKPSSIRWQQLQLENTEENILSAQLFWETFWAHWKSPSLFSNHTILWSPNCGDFCFFLVRKDWFED